jgi:hypothetical protein
VHADDAEAFFGQHPDDRGEQPVVAGERGPADAGQQLGALSVRPQVQQRRAAYRTDHDQVLAAIFTQRGDDARGRAEAPDLMWPGSQDGGIGEAFQPDNINPPARGARCRGDFGRQVTATGDYAQPAWHFCLIFHFKSRCNHSFLATGTGFSAYSFQPISRSGETAYRDHAAMMDDDLPYAARQATAANVLQCLVMLAEEAVNLNLPRTMLALRKAIRACQAEQARPVPALRPRRDLVLH